MPATPAWPPHSLPRLFVDQELGAALSLPLEGGPANYLANVLRLGPGAEVKLFDDRTGEWLARVVEVGRKRVTLTLVDRLRPRDEPPDIWLLFAPLKRAPTDWLVEKATELGVKRLVPVLTQRTVAERVKIERLRSIAIEAAEQCDRTALPEIGEPAKLTALLAGWPAERALMFADETGGTPLAQAAGPARAAILIGPEGGFTDEERRLIRGYAEAVPVSLGPRILRAETAALAALSLWMGSAGDWSRAPRG
jgi:16S rRNA (uracil1498-N3)-methyltransferase